MNEFDCLNQQTKHVVFGYIRKIQKLLRSNGVNNAYHIMPDAIIYIVLSFYHDKFRFITSYDGINLIFIDNSTIKKDERCFGYQTYIFGDELRSIKCNKLDLHIKWTKCVETIFIGFITSAISQSIEDWETFLGSGQNKAHSAGIYIYRNNAFFYLYDVDCNLKTFNREKAAKHHTYQFHDDDIFKIKFDLLENMLYFSHNDVYSFKWSLKKYNEITPALTLTGVNEEIQIIKFGYS
eukprot:483391_1